MPNEKSINMRKRNRLTTPAINKIENMIINLKIEEGTKISEGIINNLKKIILNMIGKKMRKTKRLNNQKIMDIKIIKEKTGKIKIIGQMNNQKDIIMLSVKIKMMANKILISKVATISKERIIEIMERSIK